MKPTIGSDRDGYQGMTWAERARFGVLGAALDPADKSGRKNNYIDRLHRLALTSAFGDKHFNKALDFGCGPGRFTTLLRERSTEVYAVDRTPEMLAIARQSHHLPNVHLLLWRDLPLPFEDRFFDLILSVYVVSVMPRADVASVAKEFGRVCSSNGTLVMIEQVDHSRELSPAAYHQIYNSAGFDVVRAVPIRTSDSQFMRLAMKGLSARFLRGTLARAELMWRKHSQFRPDTQGYWDYLFILRPKVTS